jgi:hypothetical protein
MARFPGTETHGNRAGFRPGDVVRCRRSRANHELGLADRRGVVTEVRLEHACVLVDPTGHTAWLANDALLPETDAGRPDLALVARLLAVLHAVRLEFEEEDLVVQGGEIPAQALDDVRRLLGERLVACSVRPEGVHLLGTRLRLDPPLG